MTTPLSSPRLDLVPMTTAFLSATVSGRHDAAEALIGLRIPSEWYEAADFAALRLREFEQGTTTQDWLPRAIGQRQTGEMIGHIGFHTPPAPAYLAPLCPEGVELGYTIFSAHRRQGFATEAIHTLVDWAHEQRGVRFFIASVSPANAASLQLIAKLGFRRIGSHIDETDGPEDIFQLEVTAPLGRPR